MPASRAGRKWAAGLLICFLPPIAACAHRSAAASATAVAAGSAGRQTLFRVRYEGSEGTGGFRLVLRLAGSRDYSLSASDLLGRALWSLRFDDGEALLVDHRARRFCRGEGELPIPEPALARLTPEALPRVLAGLLPVAREDGDPAGDDLDFRDSAARRWTATLDSGRVETWTLWEDDSPRLWFKRAAGGGILSHRAGTQFRWRRTAEEALEGGVPAIDIPAGYQEGNCDEWDLQELRQDQSASAGGRPAR